VPLTDSELIHRVLNADDRSAFGTLVQRHQSSVRGFLRQLCENDHALADDLAQDTFIQAYRSLSRFRGGSSFSTWLLGIAHNQYRNARRREVTAWRAAEELGRSEPLESTARLSDLQHDVTRAMHDLSTDEKAAVHLHYHQGLSHQEIAGVLTWPVGTVKTHLARSKDKLRSYLAAWNPQT
jgi:RNA polymerase sigma factor (sigma-70 family)